MEIFLIGCGIGCLIGVATAYLIVSKPQREEPPSWLALLDEQHEAIERFAEHQNQPRALTRLTAHSRTIEI